MSNNRPYDLSVLDFKKNRLRKRKLLVLYSLPVTVPLLLFALILALFLMSFSLAHSSYNKTDYAMANTQLQSALWLNYFDRGAILYDYGNILYKQSKFSESQTQYEKALEFIDQARECSVRINLVLALEAQSDSLTANKKYDEAIVLLDKAKSVIRDGSDSCGFNETELKQQKDEVSKKADSSQKLDAKLESDKPLTQKEAISRQFQRVEEKAEQAKLARNDDQSSDEDRSRADEKIDSADTPSEQKIDDLSSKMKSIRQKRATNLNNRQDYSRRGYDSNTKTW